MSIVNIKLSQNKGKFNIFCIDFFADFDTIDGTALFYKLSFWLSSKVKSVVKYLYNGTSSGVWCGNEI